MRSTSRVSGDRSLPARNSIMMRRDWTSEAQVIASVATRLLIAAILTAAMRQLHPTDDARP